MKCEKCGGKCHVDNSREMSKSSGAKQIPQKYKTHKSLTYRSNECNDCGYRFKSIEMTSDAFDNLSQAIKEELLIGIEKLLKQ